MKTRSASEQELFTGALSYDAGAARDQYLDEACRGDAALRRRLEALLQAHEASGGLLETVDMAADATAESDKDSAETTIGPYRLLDEIGEGGMGIVYLAEQRHPVRRRVALKIIKPGMDTRSVIARFEAERQALALMDHPCVARVLDVGCTHRERPFFVMEYVPGLPITDFVVRERLSTDERLQLLISVCRAVQHAHQKGIIHRDLKPSNVLVTNRNGTPVPKVIDFGIAKAVEQRLTDKTLHTRHDQLVGTPCYMSPEQAEFGGIDIDTRSDVYSLGVLLYEVLTDVGPYETEMLKNARPADISHIIRETPVLRPSMRIATAAPADGPAGHRPAPSETRRRQRELRGDLDWIVMKAIEKERGRRYDSAAALAEDLQRFRRGEAVTARPPSAVYRLKKTVSRHRRVAIAALLVMMSLTFGLALALVQRDRAIDAQRLAEDRLQRFQAERQRSENLLYAADIRLAARALEKGDVAQTLELLKRMPPADSDQPELRGIEWHYLYHRAKGASTSSSVSPDSLYTVCPSPDQSRLVTAGADGWLHVLDAETLAVIRSVESGQQQVNDVSFSSDGHTVCTAGDDGTVRFWSFPALIPQQVLRYSPDAEAYAALMTPDQQFVIICGQLAEIAVYRRSTGELLHQLSGHNRAVEAMALSPDGTLLACVSSDCRLSVWDWMKGTRVYLSPERGGRLSSVTFSADGRLIADGSIVGEVCVTSTADWMQVAMLNFSDGIQSLEMTSDSRELCVATRAGAVHVLPLHGDVLNSAAESASPPASAQQFRPHKGRIYSLSPADDRTIISAGQDGRVARTHRNKGADRMSPSRVPDLRSQVAAISPDAGILVCQTEQGLVTHELVSGQTDPLAESADRIPWSAISFVPGTRQLATGGAQGHLALRTVKANAEVRISQLPGRPLVNRLSFSADGSRLAVVCRRDDLVMVCDVPSLDTVWQHSVVNNQNAALSPDGQLLAYNDAHDTVIVDVNSGRQLARSRDHHPETISDLAFIKQGSCLISIGSDRSIRTWNWRQDEHPQLLGVHPGSRPVAFSISQDERTLFTCGRSGDVVVWSIPARQELLTLFRVGHRCLSMQLSENDRTLIIIGADGQLDRFPLMPISRRIGRPH
ncbi:MAG: protein kinase [Fuerstiella sp.]